MNSQILIIYGSFLVIILAYFLFSVRLGRWFWGKLIFLSLKWSVYHIQFLGLNEHGMLAFVLERPIMFECFSLKLRAIKNYHSLCMWCACVLGKHLHMSEGIHICVCMCGYEHVFVHACEAGSWWPGFSAISFHFTHGWVVSCSIWSLLDPAMRTS